MEKIMRRIAIPLLILALLLPTAGMTQESGTAPAEHLAKLLSNPVADLVSIPMQFNWDQGVGDYDATRNTLNIQPVVPFTLNEDWNLIGRWIMPFVSQPSLGPGLESTFGLSDILFSTFFSPSKSDLIWAVGPAVVLPTTDDPLLGSGKWQAGPTAVVLQQSGPWTYGFLGNHLWSFADASDQERADVSTTFLQPFLAYSTPKGITFTLNTESTYNHKAEDGEEWTVPINIGVSKVTKFGPFPMSIQAGYAYYVESPTGGPESKLRVTFTLILPRGR